MPSSIFSAPLKVYGPDLTGGLFQGYAVIGHIPQEQYVNAGGKR